MGKSSCWLAALAALAFVCPYAEGALYNSAGRDSRVLYDSHQVSCGPHTCGVGAHCTYGAVTPVCACLPGYAGDPLTRCIRPECLDHSECRGHQSCVNQRCVNPCEGTCGINAKCNVRNHLAVCSCPPGYSGKPFEICHRDPEQACHPSPCGANTKCRVSNDHAICTCLPGFRGNALSGCRHECESDAECGVQQSCRDFKCVSPCSDCGVNADCETVAAHRAICKCPRGYQGDPYSICRAECESDGDCPNHKPSCLYNACVNPCNSGVCGMHAECNLRGLSPVCSCPKGMTGNPFSYCRHAAPQDLCEPNPCGANAKCTPGHDRTGAERPVCTCPSGYIGNALVACERGECELDSDCPDSRACVGYQCVDPCLGDTQCGSGAHCMARRHIAVCTCPPGYHGDALVNCYEHRSHIVSYRYRTYPQTLILPDSATAKEVEQSSESQNENSTSSSA